MEVKIRSIKKLNPQMTVDIEVEDTHTYQLDNGMISHNTVSQLCDTSSGIHTRHSKYYIRRIRGNKVDPLTQFMIDQNVPYEEEIGKENVRVVFAFPVKSPLNSMFRDEVSAIEQLETWHLYQTHWCEHKPSVTISVKEDEWLEVGSWVYKYFDDVSGVSFLPHDGHIYRQAPYEEITREQYTEMMKTFPKHIDFMKLVEYEKEDNTVGSQELACTANGCEVK